VRWQWGLVLIVAFAVRLWAVGDHGPWTDEWLTLHTARGVLQHQTPGVIGQPKGSESQAGVRGVMAACMATDNGNGIAYFVLLHYWTTLFASSDVALRVPSVLFGLLVVYLSLLVSTKLFGPGIGVASGVLVATNPLLVRYSQEGRAYAMATALVIAATWFLLSLLDGKRALWRALAYGTCAALALLCHYLTVGVLAAQWLVFVVANPTRRSVSAAAIGGLWAAGLVLCWLIGLGGAEGLTGMARVSAEYAQRAKSPASTEIFALPANMANVSRGLVQVGSSMVGNMLQGLGWRLREVTWMLLVPGAALLGWCYQRERWRASHLVWAGALAGLLLPTALALRSGHVISFQPLYSSFATPFANMVLAVGAAGLWRVCRRWAVAVLCLQAAIVTLSLVGVWIDAPRYRPANPYPRLVLELQRAAERGAIVEFPSAVVANRVSLYWHGVAPFHLGDGTAIRILPDHGHPVSVPIPSDPYTALPTRRSVGPFRTLAEQ
jgi:4-amino-4-deoxy-L-arabinose transferase-like glycosyltransferase